MIHYFKLDLKPNACFALVPLLFILPGCGGGSPSQSALEPAPALAPPTINESMLPPPTSLAQPRDVPRRSSYVETDLIRHGKDFENGYPHQNVGGSNNDAKFSTDWSEANGYLPTSLGIAIYEFDVAGYDRAAEVRYGWSDPPDEITTAWLGLGNQDNEAWDWFPCSAGGLQTVPSFDPYISTLDTLLAVFVLANAEISSLRYVRLGPHVLDAQLSADPTLGIAPLPVIFDASASSTAVGTIDSYEWDEDADGSFGAPVATSSANYTFTNAGTYTPSVRVTSSFGVQMTASVTIAATGPWEHTWGLGEYDIWEDCCVDLQGNIYVSGALAPQDHSHEGDLLIAKYSPQGELRWVKRWVQNEGAEGGWGSVGQSIHCAADGTVYVTGVVENQVTDVGAVLLQQWTAGGELNWSRAWGGAAGTRTNGRQLLMYGDAIFVAGYAKVASGDYDAYLVKFDTGGAVDWVVSYGGTDWEIIGGAAFTGLLQPSGVALGGMTRSFGAQGEDVLLLIFDLDGVLGIKQRWDMPETQRAESIVRDATGNLYLTADDTGGTASNDILLLGVNGSGTSILELTWGTSGSDFPMDLGWASGAGLYICGWKYDLPGDPHNAVLVLLDELGVEQGAAVYGTTNAVRDWFNGIQPLAGGLLLCGIASSVTNDWTTIAGTVNTPLPYSWTGCGGSAEFHGSETSFEVAGTVTDLTAEGAIDTGGGEDDTLTMVVAFP